MAGQKGMDDRREREGEERNERPKGGGALNRRLESLTSDGEDERWLQDFGVQEGDHDGSVVSSQSQSERHTYSMHNKTALASTSSRQAQH
jgi:hypothetical protein